MGKVGGAIPEPIAQQSRINGVILAHVHIATDF